VTHFLDISRSTRPKVEIWRTFSSSNAKVNRKRPQIAEISRPIGNGVKESNGANRILNGSSQIAVSAHAL